jgi:hypothetical protein
MREILIEELNKISTKQKEIKENLFKENFDDLHSVSRANKLTLSWLELEVKKDTLKEALLKCVSLTLK